MGAFLIIMLATKKTLFFPLDTQPLLGTVKSKTPFVYLGTLLT